MFSKGRRINKQSAIFIQLNFLRLFWEGVLCPFPLHSTAKNFTRVVQPLWIPHLPQSSGIEEDARNSYNVY